MFTWRGIALGFAAFLAVLTFERSSTKDEMAASLVMAVIIGALVAFGTSV